MFSTFEVITENRMFEILEVGCLNQLFDCVILGIGAKFTTPPQ